MKIEYLGHSCFRLTFENGTTVLTDPYTRVGYELPQGLTADIVTVSHGHFDHAYTAAVNGVRLLADQPAAYAYGGVSVRGVACWHDEKGGALRGSNIAFVLCADGLTVCHLGDVGEAVSEKLLQQLGKVDVLLVPVGGTYTVDAAGAAAYVRAIHPKVAVPMHYRPKDGTIDITDEKSFLRLFQEQIVCAEPSHTVELTAETLADSQTKILFMERAL